MLTENMVPHDTGHALVLEKGEHSLTITVYNEKALPCLYVSGESIVSDSDWYCTAFDGRWVAASKSGFYFHSVTPNDFKLKSKRCKPVSQEKRREGILYDFGRETFGNRTEFPLYAFPAKRACIVCFSA